MGVRKTQLRHPIRWLKRFAEERRGVSTVEYALIVVAIIGIVGAAVGTMSGGFNALFTNLGNQIQNVVT